MQEHLGRRIIKYKFEIKISEKNSEFAYCAPKIG